MSMEKCDEEYIIKNCNFVDPFLSLDCLNEIISEYEAKGKLADHTAYSTRNMVLTSLRRYELALKDLSKAIELSLVLKREDYSDIQAEG